MTKIYTKIVKQLDVGRPDYKLGSELTTRAEKRAHIIGKLYIMLKLG